ncbi:MAG: hypothetical protein M3Z14_07255 [Candidatus Eremiobacteraeota bacterium]|nr:hypothetical protein [Candidatus Eremiobacteraeota bacterium]
MLTSRLANVVCLISAVLNVMVILGFIVALVRIHNSSIPAFLLAAALSCMYLILPGWCLARALGLYRTPITRFGKIALRTLCLVSALGIVLAAMALLGVIGAHFDDFPGPSLLAALSLVGVFAFLPCWYFLDLLLSLKPAR